MNVLVCGDRYWTDLEAIQNFLYFLGPNDTLIHGAARGADQLAAFAAIETGCSILEFPAEWDTYGRRAGPIRNRKMLAEGKPDIVIAFHNDLSKSKGTKDMVSIAEKAGIPVYVISAKRDIEIREQMNLDPEKQAFLDDVKELLVGEPYS